MDEFTWDVRRTPGTATVTVAVCGEFDSAPPELLEAIRCQPACDIDIDLAAVTFMNSSALRGLLAIRTGAIDAGATFTIRATSRSVERLFGLAGIASLLEDPDDAPPRDGRRDETRSDGSSSRLPAVET